MGVRIGTSGWSYDDWRGRVYPPGLEPREWLPFYARALPTVEINATFYRDPAPEVVAGWVRKARDFRGFEYSVKAPQDVTQDAFADAPVEDVRRRVDAWRALVVDPLREAGRLGAVLLQLSPGILRKSATLARLAAALDALAGADAAVELRNRTWLATEEPATLDPDAVRVLAERGATAVLVDGPPFPALPGDDAPHAYVRFHGRNDDIWSKGRAGESTRPGARFNRYDYLYGKDALAPWADRVAVLAKAKRVVRVYFNNHPYGKAFVDAGAFGELLAAREAVVERAESAQRKLFP